MKKRIYFDNAATTPLAKEVFDEILPFFSEKFGNPSSVHAFGREARAAIEKTRKKIAEFFSVSPSEIFFTSGGTEANNMAIQCAIRDLGVQRIITSPIEHQSVLNPSEYYRKKGMVEVNFVDIDEKGHIKLESLEKLLKKNVKTLVSLMHANNEIGNLLPLKRVSEICKKYNAYLHSDTVQTVGHYEINLDKIYIDFISCSAHKFHGPKGIGFLYINNKTKIAPMIFGGTQERNMRAGTENVAGIVGLGKALELCYNNIEEEQNYILSLKEYFIKKIRDVLPEVQFNGDYNESSLYTILNVRFPENDKSEMLLYNFDIEGIAVSGGSACSSGSINGSHVINTLYPGLKNPSIRFSFSRYNKKEEIDYTMNIIKKIFCKEKTI